MANLLVKIPDRKLFQSLKNRAAANGRSLESEIRTILTNAANKPEPLSEREVMRKNQKQH